MKLPRQGDYPIYRCPSTSDCARHVTISAVIAEKVVTDAVRAALADMEGRASMAENTREAARALERAQADLDGAVRAFAVAGLVDETSAVERLSDLRQARDEAQARHDGVMPPSELTIRADADWDELSLAARRDLIRAVIDSAVVAPHGRGAERITINLRGE
jgi:hypothetical protein